MDDLGDLRLKRMGFPFGIETDSAFVQVGAGPRLKRMGFPFGIETVRLLGAIGRGSSV